MVMEGLRRRSNVTAVLQKRNGSNKELARATRGGKGDKDKTLIVPVETRGESIGKEVAKGAAGKEDATVVPVDDRGKAVVSRENVPVSPNSRGVKRRRAGGGQTKEESLALPAAVGGVIKSGQVAPARPASARHLARKRGRDADSTAEAGVPFSLTLTKKEILEDLTKMSGHVPYKWRKVKRTNLWGPCNMLSLGRFLHLVTLEKYDPEKFL